MTIITFFFLLICLVLKMEQIRVDCISSEQYGELGEDLIEHAKMKMQNNIDLRKSMEAVFDNCSADDKVVIYFI